MQVTFNLPDEKVNAFVAMTKWLFPMPQIPDPNWLDPGDGTEAPLVNEFTDKQWAKIAWIRHWIEQEGRYREVMGKNAVKKTLDNNLIS